MGALRTQVPEIRSRCGEWDVGLMGATAACVPVGWGESNRTRTLPPTLPPGSNEALAIVVGKRTCPKLWRIFLSLRSEIHLQSALSKMLMN